MRGNIVVRLLYRLILLFMIVGSVEGWGGVASCGRSGGGVRARLGHVSHILGKMSYSHKYLNVLNRLKCCDLVT